MRVLLVLLLLAILAFNLAHVQCTPLGVVRAALGLRADTKGSISSREVSSNDWRQGRAILVDIVNPRRVVPCQIHILTGELVNGSVTSLYSDDEDFLVVAPSGGRCEILLEFSTAWNSTLHVLAFCEDNGTVKPLNVSVFDSISGYFIDCGQANGTIDIGIESVTGDGESIIKLWAENVSGYCYVSYAYLTFKPLTYVVHSEFTRDAYGRVIHRIRLNLATCGVEVRLRNISTWWRFIGASPPVEWNYSTKGFFARVPGEYYLYFLALDEWEWTALHATKIVLLDSRGRYLPFDMFKVYYRRMRTHVCLDREALGYFMRNLTLSCNGTTWSPQVILKLTEENFDFFAASENLSDFKFVESWHGQTFLVPHSVVSWNGELAIIVLRPPVIDNESVLVMYYGNLDSPDARMPSPLHVLYEDFTDVRRFNLTWAYRGDCIVYEDEGYLIGRNYSLTYKVPICPWNLSVEVFAKIYAEFGTSTLNLTLLGENSDSLMLSVRFHADYEGDSYVQQVRVELWRLSAEERRLLLATAFTPPSLNMYVRLYVSIANQTCAVEICRVDGARVYFNSTTISPKLGLSLYTFLVNCSYIGDSPNRSYIRLNHVYATCGETSELQVLSIGNETVNTDAVVRELRPESDYKLAYTNIIEAEFNALLNIVVKDLFDDVIANLTVYVNSSVIPIVIDVCSWKFKNNRDDVFVHIELRKPNSPLKMSEWVAPGEVVKYFIRPGTYQLTITYQTGEQLTYNLTVTGDMFFLLNGTVLGDVIAHLGRVNSTLVRYIQTIDIEIRNVNATILNQTLAIRIHIENVNVTLSSLLLALRTNLTAINSTVSEALLQLSNNVSLINSFIRELNSSLTTQIESVNATIVSMIIDLNERVVAINTTIGQFLQNISSTVELMNSSLLRLLVNISSAVLSMNSTILRAVFDLRSDLISVNTTLGSLLIDLNSSVLLVHSNLSSLIMRALTAILASNATILSVLYNLSSLLTLTNATVCELLWDIGSGILQMNSTVCTLLIDIKQGIIAINTTIGSVLANISGNLLLLESLVYSLNSTLIAVIYDANLNVTRTIVADLSELENLAEAIREQLNVFHFVICDKLSGERIPQTELYQIVVNGRPIAGDLLVTLADRINVSLVDFWGRVLWSSAVNTSYVKIEIPAGRLVVVNERDRSITVSIAPEGYTKEYATIVPPYSAEKMYLPLGTYRLRVEEDESELASSQVTLSEDRHVVVLRVTFRGVEEYLSGRSLESLLFPLGAVTGAAVTLLGMALARRLRRRAGIDLDELIRKLAEEGVTEVGEEISEESRPAE